jgi:hypothetical protein
MPLWSNQSRAERRLEVQERNVEFDGVSTQYSIGL